MNRYEFYSKLESFKANKSSNELTHYGIIGQKWGTRRWQNADGTFNDEGKQRYFGKSEKKEKAEEKSGSNDVKVNWNYPKDFKGDKKKVEKEANLWIKEEKEKAKGLAPYETLKSITINIKPDGTFFKESKYDTHYEDDESDQKIGSIFNKKNVSYNDPKYNPHINEENKIWDDVKEQQSKNWAKDKELINDLAGKELKYYGEDPILSEYYSNIKADIANKMKEKYPSMNPNTIRMNTLHDEDEPFVSGYDGQEELREQYKELHEKAIKYPPRSAKRVKLEGEAALVNAKEELNQKKIEEELNENVEKYIKENKNNILQDINRIRGKIKDINIVDDFGDYYVTRALEEHNKKKYNNFNEKGLKDLSDDEWDDVKNIAKAEYEDDISRRNKRNNDQKFGSSEGESEDYKEWYKKFHEEEMKRFDNWNNVGKKVKLNGGDVRNIYDSNEDLYDENAKQLILKNADKIHKMDKALSKGDMKTFNKIRDTFDDDYEKDLAEHFIKDKGKLKIQQAEIKHLQNEFDSDKNTKGKIAIQDNYDGIYPSDMLKDPKKLETFKQSANDLKDNYNKHNEIITNKLVDMYYNAFKNTYGYEDHPLTKSEFKNAFNDVSGTLYPNGILEGYIESKEYGDHGTAYYFDYDVLNKTLSYIDEEGTI